MLAPDVRLDHLPCYQSMVALYHSIKLSAALRGVSALDWTVLGSAVWLRFKFWILQQSDRITSYVLGGWFVRRTWIDQIVAISDVVIDQQRKRHHNLLLCHTQSRAMTVRGDLPNSAKTLDSHSDTASPDRHTELTFISHDPYLATLFCPSLTLTLSL